MASLAMNMDPFGRPMNGTIPTHKSMMGDIFGPVSPPYMGKFSVLNIAFFLDLVHRVLTW